MKPTYKRFLKALFCFIFVASITLAGILWMTSLYQLEVVDRNILAGINTFDMPFYLGGPVNIWVARDYWYAVNAYAILIIGQWACTLFAWIVWMWIRE